MPLSRLTDPNPIPAFGKVVNHGTDIFRLSSTFQIPPPPPPPILKQPTHIAIHNHRKVETDAI